jgi:hypothetical protein
MMCTAEWKDARVVMDMRHPKGELQRESERLRHAEG